MDSSVTVYTKKGYLWCQMAMQWLAKKDIHFEQKDVTDDPSFLREFEDLGATGYPCTVIKENGQMVETIEGFNMKKLIEFFVS